MKSHSESYKAAGVDVTAGYEAVRLMKPAVQSTFTKGVIGGIGGFGGFFEPDMGGMARPVLVSGTDGVGTKLKIAFLMDKHDTVGIDCVAMCVNDIICSGAKPLFFLDYIAVGKNDPKKVAAIVSGVAEGCRQAQCALIGGETAEMPGFYPEDEYDLAGFCTGLVDYEKAIDGKTVAEGDVLIGLASSGVHSNGFSLVRRALRIDGDAVHRYVPELSMTLGEALLTPTKIYVQPLLPLIKAVRVKAVSHITGGGFFENIPRMLPNNLCAVIEKNAVVKPRIFSMIAKAGNVPERDMFNTFNMGVGMCIAVDKNDVNAALESLKASGETAFVIGEVRHSQGSDNEGGVELW